ncbi:hypothetical protein V5O48_010621 [Marasmius crinis-equi]|uniref:FAD-binding domain-containing protein n=1 Tax=Marasmius crinis-equi TaxID=585013 RepID=A0ABR3F7W0_9AGAR
MAPDISEGRKAPLSLRIAIIGGGIGGLSAAYCLAKAGHEVTVFESKDEIREAGAGIMATPNVIRLFYRWGLAQKLEAVAQLDHSEGITTFRHTGELLNEWPMGEAFEQETGYPTFQLHRADLINLIHEIASPLVKLRLGSEITSLDATAPSVTLKSGETVSADLIVGADGVHSFVRAALGNPQVNKSTGGFAYRYLIPAEDLLGDPELRSMIDTPGVYIWLGAHKKLVAYGIRGRSILNVAAFLPDDTQTPDTPTGDLDALQGAFAGEPWESRARKIVELAKSRRLLKWKILHNEPLDRWIHPDGPVTLLGDACQVIPPHSGQGAAITIEDAAVLGNLFSRISDRSQIKALLQAYQEIRQPRRTATWLDTMEQTNLIHLPDEEQRRKVPGVPVLGRRKAHELTIPIHCSHDFGYDPDEVVDIWWKKGGEGITAIGD